MGTQEYRWTINRNNTENLRQCLCFILSAPICHCPRCKESHRQKRNPDAPKEGGTRPTFLQRSEAENCIFPLSFHTHYFYRDTGITD